MKERSTSAQQNNGKTEAGSSSANSQSEQQQQQPNLLSPYNSINFMAPPIGGTIKCTTCLGNTTQGKVIAYDQHTKMLALRTPVANKPGYYDFSIINVAWCSNLEVIEEPTEPLEPLSSLNTKKLERRQKINIENKLKEINSIGNDVPSIAQHIFFSIYKTLEEVEWEGKNIVIMKSVAIKPPYDVSSVQSKNGENLQAVEHVKKIVKKVNEEFQAANQSLTSVQTPTSASTTTA